MICKCAWGALVLLVLLPWAPVRAQAPVAKQKARALLIEGNTRYEKGQHAEALRLFRAAHAAFPSYKILYNMATTLNDMGRPTEAAGQLERYFEEGGSEATDELARSARQLLAKLNGRLASIRVRSGVAGQGVFVGGRLRGLTPLKKKVYLIPGSHLLTVRKKGFLPFSKRLVLKAGEHRSVPVTLTPKPALPAARPAAPTAAVPTPRPRPGPGSAAGDGRRRIKTIWAYSTLGVGLALAVGAGVLYGVGASQGETAQDDYRSATGAVSSGVDRDEVCRYHDEVESARSKIVAGNVLAGAAVVALGISIYQFVTRPAPARQQTGDRAMLHLAPTARGATLVLGGRF